MLALISLLLFLSVAMIVLIIHIIRPDFAYLWLVTAIGALVAFMLMLLAGFNLPQAISLVTWEPQGLFPVSPSLQIDQISWPFATALAGLCLAVILTAAVRIFQVEGHAWPGSLLLTGLGLAAVLSGNPLTMLLAWAALDLAELVILFSQVKNPKITENIFTAFTIRVGAILLYLWSVIQSYQAGVYTFDDIPSRAATFAFLAAGLRLGVLPFHLPSSEELPLRRGIGTTLRLAPAASCFVLLARTASIEISATPGFFLLLLAALAGIYGSLIWATASDELNGRPFWIIGGAALSLAAAVQGHPSAVIAWGLACILPGSLLSLASARHRYLLPFLMVGLVCISTLPYAPAWDGAQVYTPMRLTTLAPFFFLVHLLLLVGYLRHSFRSGSAPAGLERWVWALYALGLVLLVMADLLAAYWGDALIDSWRVTAPSSIWAWVSGIFAIGLTVLILLWSQRASFPSGLLRNALGRTLPVAWLNRLLWSLYGSLRLLVEWITNIMEGEGGVLWAAVLLALLFILLIQVGVPGG